MKKLILISLFIILYFFKILYAGVIVVDDFENYASSAEVSATYSPGDWHSSSFLNFNDTYGKSLKVTYNSITWGAYVTRVFLTPYNLENYRGVIIYLKGDGSDNKFKIQLRESSISGNLDGEAWEQDTGISLSYQGYNSYFIKFSDLRVTSATKKSGVLDLTSIAEMSFLVYKNNNTVNGKFYIDNIKFVPKTVAETYPHNEVKISPPDKVKIFLNLKINPITYTNYISISENGTVVPGTFNYDVNKNIISFTPTSSFGLNKTYKINFSENLELSGIEDVNINGFDEGKTNEFYTTSDLSIDGNGGYLQDKDTGIIIEIPYNSVTGSDKVQLQSYSGIELQNATYIENKGIKLVASSLLKPLTLMVYKYYFTETYSSFANKDLTFYNYAGGWKKVSSDIESGFIKAGVTATGIYGIGEDTEKREEDIIFDINLSANPFTPNNDGKNDEVKIYFKLSQDSLVNIDIYDNNGKKVKSILRDTSLSAGNYFYNWDGRNETGDIVVPDFYIYRISVVYEDSGKTKEIIKRGVISVLY